VMDALGRPQSVLLLGGTSDIGLAIVARYLDGHPLRVVLAARDSPRLKEAAALLSSRGAVVETVEFDAAKPQAHAAALGPCFAQGDIDLAIVAFGLLPDQRAAMADQVIAVRTASVNFTGAVSVGVVLAQARIAQGHGVIIALSSVAGERPRPANFVYGSAKAGVSAFYDGLADSLTGTGVRVVVVRAGFVRSRMTAHLPAPPLAGTPERTAAAITEAVWRGRAVVWTPGSVRVLAAVIRLLPRRVLRRIPL
jgi:decaprenylphospho-beta-D-erythro-pentofuranosid-2-ulose 2-reductase